MKKLLIAINIALLTFAVIAEAQTPLRQSTSRVVRICGAVAVGDGFTPVTTLALGSADEAEVLRDNTATLDISGATFSAITGADGCYSLTLDTTATNTVGELIVVIQDDSLILPLKRTFQVVEESVYDNLYAGSAVGPLTAAQVNTEADTALSDYDPPTNAELEARTIVAAGYFDPSADTVSNVTTVATLTGHTPQTGDSFARLGAPSGASIAADIADVPTVSEFNARTLAGAAYFDPAADTVANVTTAGSVTGSVGSISGITFPINFGDLDIEATTGHVDVGSWNGTEITTALQTAADIADAVLDEDLTAHQTSGTLGAAIGDGDAGAGMTESGGTGDHLTAINVASMSANSITASAMATSAVDEIRDRPLAVDLNCEVNTANFAGSTTTLACILTDRDGGGVTQASNDLEGKLLEVTSGDQIREVRYIRDTTWDGANSELQITLSRALPGTLADAVTANIK